MNNSSTIAHLEREIWLVEPAPIDMPELTEAAAASGDSPSPRLTQLLALAGAKIFEHAGSLNQAEDEALHVFCWVAIRRDRHNRGEKWFAGHHRGYIDVIDVPGLNVGPLGAHLGRLARSFLDALCSSPEFEIYWDARARACERIERAKAARRPVSALELRELTERIAVALEKQPGKTEEEWRTDVANWLKTELQKRSWNEHDLSRHSAKPGPGGWPPINYMTVRKILDGKKVWPDMYEKVIYGLLQKGEIIPMPNK